MKTTLKFALLSLILASSACSDEANNGQPDGGSDDDAAVSNGTDNNGTGNNGTIVVDGPNGYTLVLGEFADSADWSYQTDTVLAKLCGTISADRTLNIFRSTVSPTQDVLCGEDGATEQSVLNFSAGRELEQPTEDGEVVTADGTNGSVTSGGAVFGKSGMGTVGVEISNPDDATILPATLYVQTTTDTGQLKFVFSGEAF